MAGNISPSSLGHNQSHDQLVYCEGKSWWSKQRSHWKRRVNLRRQWWVTLLTCTHTHTHMHTNTHTYTCIHSHTQTQMCANAYTQVAIWSLMISILQEKRLPLSLHLALLAEEAKGLRSPNVVVPGPHSKPRPTRLL